MHVTNLAPPNDVDYPGAAKKHLDDATALMNAQRFDGAGYLIGYVVECSLLTVILVGELEQRGRIPPRQLARELRPNSETLRRYRGAAAQQARSTTREHDLAQLAKVTTTYASVPSRAIAAYVPPLDVTKPPLSKRTSSLRYQCEGKLTKNDVVQWLTTAEDVYAKTIGRMIRDGLVQP